MAPRPDPKVCEDPVRAVHGFVGYIGRGPRRCKRKQRGFSAQFSATVHRADSILEFFKNSSQFVRLDVARFVRAFRKSESVMSVRYATATAILLSTQISMSTPASAAECSSNWLFSMCHDRSASTVSRQADGTHDIQSNTSAKTDSAVKPDGPTVEKS